VNKRLAVAFTGPSNSGKTTLIVKVSEALKREGKKVAIIKNDPKDKATFDVEGKDSHKFSQTGAEVVVTSPQRTTFLSKRHKELDEIIELFNEFDFLLVEGLKNLPLPRISIFRNKIDDEYYPYMNALAIDETINIDGEDIPQEIEVLDLNNTDQIIDWIKNNAKEV